MGDVARIADSRCGHCINREKANYTTALLGQVLCVAHSECYGWSCRKLSARAQEDAAHGGSAPRSPTRPTRPSRTRGARPHGPESSHLWCGDVTCILIGEWLYLSVLLNAHSRLVVGWATALRACRPSPGLTDHTDWSCQYDAAAYRAPLAGVDLACSPSSSGDRFDNTTADCFFAILFMTIGFPLRCIYSAFFTTESILKVEASTALSKIANTGALICSRKGGEEHGEQEGQHEPDARHDLCWPFTPSDARTWHSMGENARKSHRMS